MELGVVLVLGVLAHVCGDYVLQTSWMAREKLRRMSAALAHAGAYSLPFVPLLMAAGPTWAATVGWVVVAGTHAVLDRYRVARAFIWARNQAAPRADRYRFVDADGGGFAPGTPVHLSSWLATIVDNFMHVLINSAALWWVLST